MAITRAFQYQKLRTYLFSIVFTFIAFALSTTTVTASANQFDTLMIMGKAFQKPVLVGKPTAQKVNKSYKVSILKTVGYGDGLHIGAGSSGNKVSYRQQPVMGNCSNCHSANYSDNRHLRQPKGI